MPNGFKKLLTPDRVGLRFVAYCLVAAGSFAVDFLVYVSLTWSGVLFLHAQMISRVTGGVFSFVINRTWSFGNNSNDDPGIGSVYKSGRRFLLLYAISYCLALAILWVCVTILGFSETWGKVTADGVCFLFNFTVMKIYVFHHREGPIARLRTRYRKTDPVSR